jgi:putative ATPase
MEQLSLFQNQCEQSPGVRAPLAERMRPRNLQEFVGQAHLLGPGRILDRLLSSRTLQSMIFWGPPGSGKTTLAKIVAECTDTHLISLSAVMAGTREIRAAVEEAKDIWIRRKKRTCLFMDEVHRLNKAQQDTLLPHVENGTLLLMGASTENPSFEVIRPLLSRARVLVLEPLSEEDLRIIAHNALADKDRGLGIYTAELTGEAEEYLFASGGDARIVLNVLEVAVLTTNPDEVGERIVDLEAIREALQRRAVHYDKGGEEHYNLISALHKSIRGSDPDGALYWLARMLEAGEDPLYIARRLVRMASEDIGLADPFALVEALGAFRSYDFLGSPEGELALAQITIYLALAPKSNSIYTAFGKAKELARKTGDAAVPVHLRNAPTALLKKLGYARDYRYPHDDPQGWVPETYLPDALIGMTLFDPSSRGWEGKWRQTLLQRREQVRQEINENPRRQKKNADKK